MKMVLEQRIAVLADGDLAAGLEIDLDRVAVVDDSQRLRFVGNLNLGQISRNRAGKIDRRLLAAGSADLGFGGKLAPMVRPLCAGVRPMRLLSRRARQAGADRANRYHPAAGRPEEASSVAFSS